VNASIFRGCSFEKSSASEIFEQHLLDILYSECTKGQENVSNNRMYLETSMEENEKGDRITKRYFKFSSTSCLV